MTRAEAKKGAHIPYRNNKLTMLMKDSLGGTAKTLMFVNISPSDYNFEETQTSLFYASRVKLITNDAQKNVESKEMGRLKAESAKMAASKDKLLAMLKAQGVDIDPAELD